MMKKFYRLLAKSRLSRHYKYLSEVNTILEEYIMDRLLSGNNNPAFLEKGRKDLVEKQNELKENKNFIRFLKKIK
jgi:hypothetical protein